MHFSSLSSMHGDLLNMDIQQGSVATCLGVVGLKFSNKSADKRLVTDAGMHEKNIWTTA